MKILITGGAGNIGGSLARRLVLNPDYYVVVADNLITGSKDKLPSTSFKNWKFIKCNVNDWQDVSALMISYQFDYVFHYAAMVGVKRTLENPLLVLRDIDGLRNVLDLCKNTGVNRVFYSSSSEVYGEPVEIPQNEETTPLNSKLPYAIVKNLGEAYLRTYEQEYGLSYTIFRFFNTYGPMQSTDFVISKFLDAALKGDDITVYGDGSQTRTFCYIDDNLDATINTFERELYINDVANFGNDEELTILELAETVKEVTQSDSRIVHLDPLKEGDMTRRKPDISKMIKALGRQPISVKEGLQKMLELKDEFHTTH